MNARAALTMWLCLVACRAPAPSRPLAPAPTREPPPDATVPSVDSPPERDAPLGCEPFDLRNPACRSDPRMCTLGHANCKCPAPPSVDHPGCWAVMPCPTPPDPRVRACK
ncbi:MAG: hypothetical protein R3B48_15640 [Kofleriaceae bacterium]